MRNILVGLIIALFILYSNTMVFAGSSFRCGNVLVHIGDTIYEVAAKCGEPDYRDITIIEEGNNYRGRVTTRRHIRIYAGSDYDKDSSGNEKWHYDCGSKKFIYILSFTGSKLRKIEAGGYGSDKCLPCPPGSWSERKKLSR